jgi:hypothetical protein
MSRRVSEAAAMLGRRGGKARSMSMSLLQRREAARTAANARWVAVRRRPCPLCGRVLGTGRLARSSEGMSHADCRLVDAHQIDVSTIETRPPTEVEIGRMNLEIDTELLAPAEAWHSARGRRRC